MVVKGSAEKACKLNIAVLNKKDLNTHPYAEWIGNIYPDADIFLYTPDRDSYKEPDLTAEYNKVSFFKDWKLNRAVDLEIHREHEIKSFDRIIALSECDISRAGQLREELDISGPQNAVTLAYRDKVVMKTYAEKAGMKVPRFKLVYSGCDVIDFYDKNPGSIIIKPIDGAGAVGVKVLHSKGEVERWVKKTKNHMDMPLNLIVEEFIAAPIITIDGLMDSGEVLVSMVNKYYGTCLEAATNNQPIAVLGLDPKSDRSIRATEYARQLIRALPNEELASSFHLELFDSSDGLILCEIAARTGGSRYNDLMKSSLGIDFEQASCLLQVCGKSALKKIDTVKSGNLYGFILLPRCGGILRKAPNICTVKGVIDYNLHYHVGDVVPLNEKCTSAMADALFMASSSENLMAIYEQILSWYSSEFIWDNL